MPPPSPVQQPRIPIWVVGAWPRRKSIARAARYDGLLPVKMDQQGKIVEFTPDDIREMRIDIEARRPDAPPSRYDIVIEGVTSGLNRQAGMEKVLPWIEAGATWWIEAMWEQPDLKQVLERIRQGPPCG